MLFPHYRLPSHEGWILHRVPIIDFIPEEREPRLLNAPKATCAEFPQRGPGDFLIGDHLAPEVLTREQTRFPGGSPWCVNIAHYDASFPRFFL